jgi:hypothetical protein
MSRRMFVQHYTTPDDLEALSRLSWYLRFLKQAERRVPAEHRERAVSDFQALERCYQLLEKMLVAGLSHPEDYE